MLADRILLLAPHPDDELVGCATAIRRARAEGCTVSVLFLTSGVPRVECFWPWQRETHLSRISIRWQEAMRAARHAGFAVAGRQNVASRTLKENIGATLDLIRATMRELAVQVVWTPAYEGGHQDHDVTHFIAGRLPPGIPVWEFAEYNFAGGQVQANRFPDARDGEEAIVLDQREIQEKLAALKIYRSERRNLKHCTVAREAFRPFAPADYDRQPHPGTLFYQRFQWVPKHPRIDHCRPVEVSAAIRGWLARSDDAARAATI